MQEEEGVMRVFSVTCGGLELHIKATSSEYLDKLLKESIMSLAEQVDKMMYDSMTPKKQLQFRLAEYKNKKRKHNNIQEKPRI